MKKDKATAQWILYAESDLALAGQKRTSKKILYETLCFHCQQAAEKALKAVLIFYDVHFDRTHDISLLLRLLKSNGVAIPKAVEQSKSLSDYAVTVRYPGDEEIIDSKEFKSALKISKQVLDWANLEINNEESSLFKKQTK